MKKDVVKNAKALINSNTASKLELSTMLSQIVNEIEKDDAPKWWVFLLKTLAYLIGLLLAGYGTAAAAIYLM